MASPKSIVIVTFLLVALELARGGEVTCKTKEDCNGRMDCIQVEGERLTCDINGACACINGGGSVLAAAAPKVNDNDVGAPMCKKDKDCRRLRCIDAKVKCSKKKCTCIRT